MLHDDDEKEELKHVPFRSQDGNLSSLGFVQLSGDSLLAGDPDVIENLSREGVTAAELLLNPLDQIRSFVAHEHGVEGVAREVEHAHVKEDGHLNQDLEASQPVSNAISHLRLDSSEVGQVLDLSMQLELIAGVAEQRSQWEDTGEKDNEAELQDQLHVIIDDWPVLVR